MLTVREKETDGVIQRNKEREKDEENRETEKERLI